MKTFDQRLAINAVQLDKGHKITVGHDKQYCAEFAGNYGT